MRPQLTTSDSGQHSVITFMRRFSRCPFSPCGSIRGAPRRRLFVTWSKLWQSFPLMRLATHWQTWSCSSNSSHSSHNHSSSSHNHDGSSSSNNHPHLKHNDNPRSDPCLPQLWFLLRLRQPLLWLRPSGQLPQQLVLVSKTTAAWT